MINLILSSVLYAQDTVMVHDLTSTQTLTYDFETVFRKNLEGTMMNALNRTAYRVIGSVNLIPEMEKTKDINKCVTANCEINMAKAMGVKYVVTSEYTVLEGTHHLAIVLSDALTNAMVHSQMYECPDVACILSVKPNKITSYLNSISIKPVLSYSPVKTRFTMPELPDLPDPKTVGNIALAAAIVAPIVYIFADNISNISQK